MGAVTPPSEHVLLLTVSGEVHLKSARTQRKLRRVLHGIVRERLATVAPTARLGEAPRGRLLVEAADPADLERAATAAAQVFGIYRVTRARGLAAPSFDALVDAMAEVGAPLVAGKTFAARVRRRGSHDWHTGDAERAIGARLLPAAAGVNLKHPEVEVRAEVYDDVAYLIEHTWPGADGLPLGTQEPCLALLSGGFDSPVAAWLMLRRGSPVELVHFKMDCAQSDHALAVAYGVWERWGAGWDPIVWVVDFEDVKDSLLEHVPSQQRQVVLKQLMFQAADELAGRRRIPALVTGESVGQVSSQTIANLAEIDRAAHRTILRPLAGFTKDEILIWARRIGSHDLSARAKEVCNLATGPVEVAARRSRLDHARASLPQDLIPRALASRSMVRLAEWMPGMDLVPAAG